MGYLADKYEHEDRMAAEAERARGPWTFEWVDPAPPDGARGFAAMRLATWGWQNEAKRTEYLAPDGSCSSGRRLFCAVCGKFYKAHLAVEMFSPGMVTANLVCSGVCVAVERDKWEQHSPGEWDAWQHSLVPAVAPAPRWDRLERLQRRTG